MSKKVGRNEPCHCGSGKKYKVCHGRSAAGGSNRWMLIGGVVGVVALGYFVNKILTSDGQNNPPPGKVWSPEHGHWHDATATSTPLSTPLIPQPSIPTTESTSEPPGPAPPGQVWSPDHGHFHDAPSTSTPLSTPLIPQPSIPTTESTSEPPGPAPPGQVWSPDHGHFHDAPVITTPVVPKTLSETPPEFEK